MESRKGKNVKHKIKKKSQNLNDSDKKNSGGNNNSETVRNHQNTDKISMNTISFTQLQEGVYKNISANGLSYNVMSCCTNVDLWQTTSERRPWWDNITSLYFSDDQHDGRHQKDADNTLNRKEKDKDASSGTRPENGSNVLRKTNQCDNCDDSRKHADKRASAATSTFSFKTAVNDKANIHDEGHIKFLDEGENDTRKFYVGASGFLKDDAYEVIIQLRKKESEKISNYTPQDKNSIEIRTSVDNSNKENNLDRQSIAVQSIDESLKDTSESVKHITSPKEKPVDLSTRNKTDVSEKMKVSKDEVIAPEEILAGGSKKDEPLDKVPEISDKGISTTFRDSFALPDDMPKLEPISKPVTSIYTQTTPNSTLHRPIFMHLSSSTSTTYMSPPELILPRYLKKGSSESYDNIYEPLSRNLNDKNMRITSCKICRCGKCRKQKKEAKADAPPNSTRSTDQTTDNLGSEESYKKYESRHKNNRSHKCKKRSDPNICSKQKFNRNFRENKHLHSGSNHSNQSIKKSKILNHFDKINLNPVIENYVKKLLALNKEGLKAIEVVNQECSAVSTPGSSVIDVPSNINENSAVVCNKISLQQIKSSLEKQILQNITNRNNDLKSTGSQTEKNIKFLYKLNRKRPVHKVKSLNISKQLLKNNKDYRRQSVQSTVITTSPCSVSTKKRKTDCSNRKKSFQNQNLPNRRQLKTDQEISNNTSNSETSRGCRKTYKSGDKIKTSKTIRKINPSNKHHQAEAHCESHSYPFPCNKATIRSNSSESETSNCKRNHRNLSTPPISISTQTNQVDSEIEFMKLAENKLQNMEKIADLTEKCTKRLSNLAKVLEEVRRNKSLVYSQVSTSDSPSDSDQRSDKNMQTDNNRTKTFNPSVQIQTLSEALSSIPASPQQQKNHEALNASKYVPILMDLPKPDTFKTPPLAVSTETDTADAQMFVENQFIKNRGKPPPALNRINLKHVPEGFVIPHELSTVVEVDSPMSIKVKSHTTQMDNKYEGTDTEIVENINNVNKIESSRIIPDPCNKVVDPSDLISKGDVIFNGSKRRFDTQSTDTSDDSRLKMMDLKRFNEIMLKPFVSLKDYAKQYHLDELDGQASLNGVSKDENVNEELSSLHSEASIPDVMAELLKRNLISEPFKFETTSNVNSTTMSSESTLSLLALSRARKDKKKSAMLVKNKENFAESSVSLSVSSNPDLEHAFQKLGMGWASSTLKKTKERLALSSSSNTSSSSIPQFKIKSFNYQDIPELSSLLNISNKEEIKKPQVESKSEIPKNALQQTALTNSMTVKEFLTNELANKITFSNKTNRNTTDEEFISLYETKIPEEMKYVSQKPDIKETSVDSLPSGGNNRARTSTPVQIYKSMAYHSSSSSNTSNGLFSNADELSSVKGTSNSIKNHSTSDKDDLTIPNYSLKIRKEMTECSKSD